MKRSSAVATAMILLAALAGYASAQTPPSGDKPAIVPSASLTPPPDAPPPHATTPGPYAVSIIAEPTLMSHTVYRPTDLKPFSGKTRLPIVAWGNGWLPGTLLGVLTIGVLRNGLNVLAVPSSLQSASIGLLVIAALLVDSIRGRG